MAQTCGFCQDEIGDVPKIELLCHHFFHTNCFLLNMGDQCAVCEEPFLHDEEGQEEEVEVASVHSDETTAAPGHQRVLNLYNTNRTFRRDIKTYQHAASSVNKPRNEFKKLVARKKAELAEPYALIKARYEGLYTTKKEEIVQSEVYKNYKKTDARMRRLYTKLTRDYRVYSYHFPTLQTLPGLKRLRKPNRWRYYTRPLSILQRALRLRLPRY
jgi:hypothetical protein